MTSRAPGALTNTADASPSAAGTAVLPRTFVVPLDGSDFASRAMPVARDFAATFGADVVVVTTPHALDAVEPRAETALPTWLAELVEEPSEAPVHAVVAATTDPPDAVVTEVGAHPGAAVCMATHARGPIGSGALGNVAQDVLRRVGTPVLLVGRHCRIDDRTSGPVVVAHDGSAAADAVLAHARAWAHALDVPVVLVYVYHPLDAATRVHPDDALEAARRHLGPSARLEVVASSFAPGAIRDLAHELDASLIALATHGQSGRSSVCMGRVASWVTRESAGPVLVARPAELSG